MRNVKGEVVGMKKRLAMLVTMSMILTSMAACGSENSTQNQNEEKKEEKKQETSEKESYEGETLVVQAWGGTYEETMRNDVIAKFEEKTGAKVEVVSGAAPLSQLATEGDNASIDVLSLDCNEVVQGTKMGVLETLDYDKLDNAKDLYEEAFMYDNAVITNWGVYGIVYRKDLVEKEPESWEDLWDPAYKGGKIGVVDYSMGGGLEFADEIARIQGSEISDRDNWDKLFEKLSSLKDNIGIYGSQHADIESMLTSGEIVMSVETNGRAINLVQEGYDIGFCMPKEGTPAMTSLAGISKGSTNKELAYLFLNELLGTEAQKAYAEKNYYAPSNKKTVVDEKLAAMMPYGQEEVSNLVYMDYAAFEEVKADFLERWNKEFK